VSLDGQGCTGTDATDATDAQACIALLVWRGLAEEATAQHLPAPTRNKVLRALQGEQAETLCLLRDMLAGMLSHTSSRHADAEGSGRHADADASRHADAHASPHRPDMLPNIESSQGSRSGDSRSASWRLGRRGEVVLVGRSPSARLHLVLTLCACVEALVTVTPCSVTAATRVLDTLPLLLERPFLVRLPPLALLVRCGSLVRVARSASLPPVAFLLRVSIRHCGSLPPVALLLRVPPSTS